MKDKQLVRTGGILIGMLMLITPTASAATIRLKDKTTVKGKVVRVSDDGVLVSLPRAAIEAINGKPLAPALMRGVAAPAFRADDLQGTPRTLGTGQGKATVLHFWVTWCPHCRADAPKLQALHNQFRDHPKLSVLTVNLDERRELVDRFIQEHGVTYPVIYAGTSPEASGEEGSLPELYQVSAFPVTYLIDAQGVIQHKFTGSFAEGGEDLGRLVTDLLSKTKRAPILTDEGSIRYFIK